MICLVLPECLSVKICYILPSDSEANRDGADAEFSFLLFFSFSVSFKFSSPLEKVAKIVFVLGLVGQVSVCTIHYCCKI